MPILYVTADPPYDQRLIDRAAALSETLGLPVRKLGEDGCDLRLLVTPARLELRVERGPLAGGRGVYADLLKIDTTSPAGRSLSNPLLKAMGIRKGDPHRPRVIDATAGLGGDTWLLAAQGCAVEAIERHPIVAALLDDALGRATMIKPDIAGRITLHHRDALAWTGCLSNQSGEQSESQPDAILLDPMFPPGRKAAERKPMRVLRMLAGDDDDADALLDAALATGAHRVVVKRPLHAPPLGDRKPDVAHRGKAVRMDVYIQNDQ